MKIFGGLILLGVAGCSLTGRDVVTVSTATAPAVVESVAVSATSESVELVETVTPLATAPVTRSVDADGLNVRSEPGLDGTILDWLARGDVVRVLGERGDWSFVSTRVGKYGWVKTEYLK